MKFIIISFLFLLQSFVVNASPSECTPLFIKAIDVQKALVQAREGDGVVSLGNININRDDKRCKRKIFVIMPGNVDAEQIDIGNITSALPIDFDVQIIGRSNVSADKVVISNFEGVSRKVKSRIDLGVLKTNNSKIGNYEGRKLKNNLTLDSKLNIRTLRNRHQLNRGK